MDEIETPQDAATDTPAPESFGIFSSEPEAPKAEPVAPPAPEPAPTPPAEPPQQQSADGEARLSRGWSAMLRRERELAAQREAAKAERQPPAPKDINPVSALARMLEVDEQPQEPAKDAELRAELANLRKQIEDQKAEAAQRERAREVYSTLAQRAEKAPLLLKKAAQDPLAVEQELIAYVRHQQAIGNEITIDQALEAAEAHERDQYVAGVRAVADAIGIDNLLAAIGVERPAAAPATPPPPHAKAPAVQATIPGRALSAEPARESREMTDAEREEEAIRLLRGA